MATKAAMLVIGLMVVATVIAFACALWYVFSITLWLFLGLYYVLMYSQKHHKIGVLRAAWNGIKRYHSRVTPKNIRNTIKDILLGVH